MKANQKIELLRAGLAPYFANPPGMTHIEFRDSYNEIWVGIASNALPRIPIDQNKSVFPITIFFDVISQAEIVNGWDTKYSKIERYVPIQSFQKNVAMNFDIVAIKVMTSKGIEKLHAWVTDRPRERLVFSNKQSDFDRFNLEVIGTH